MVGAGLASRVVFGVNIRCPRLAIAVTVMLTVQESTDKIDYQHQKSSSRLADVVINDRLALAKMTAMAELMRPSLRPTIMRNSFQQSNDISDQAPPYCYSDAGSYWSVTATIGLAAVSTGNHSDANDWKWPVVDRALKTTESCRFENGYDQVVAELHREDQAANSH